MRSAIHCIFRENYDLVHTHHLAGAFIVPILRLKYKRVVVTSHGMPVKTKKWPMIAPIYYPIMRVLFAKFSTAITTVSKLDSKYYETYTNKKILYIPNGVDKMQICLPEIHLRPDIFFAAGRIIPTKGCLILPVYLLTSAGN